MLSKKLHSLRRARGLTLSELADAIGTSKQTISRYEKGIISNIPKEKIELLARALQVSPSELMGWEENLDRYDNLLPLGTKRLPMLGRIACGKPIFAETEQASGRLNNEPQR